MKRELHKAKLIAALSLTVLIFLMIIVTNNYFNEMRMNEVKKIYNDIKMDAMNAEAQYEILSENPCLMMSFDPISSELFELGNKLTDMETTLGKTNEQVLDMKKYYSILEARHWLFVKKVSKQCNSSATPILFFYSNLEDCPDCESQGFVLNYVRKTIPNTQIYSFDVNLDSGAVSALKANYNVTEVPSIVIKEQKYTGFRDSDSVMEIIKK
ncbi:hypothetical protein JXB27_04715 [Candidatus Woesearchaeota archaeon]|nr:hypothetical protein [Candidatus Woesearchaeota archaeon]